jgi:hypothetical protein
MADAACLTPLAKKNLKPPKLGMIASALLLAMARARVRNDAPLWKVSGIILSCIQMFRHA